MRDFAVLTMPRDSDFALQKRSWGKLMDMTLRPGDFPLGSLESRMAVRAELERANDSRPYMRVLYVGHPSYDCGGKRCYKAADREPDRRFGELSPGACGLTTGKLVVFADGGVGEIIFLDV